MLEPTQKSKPLEKPKKNYVRKKNFSRRANNSALPIVRVNRRYELAKDLNPYPLIIGSYLLRILVCCAHQHTYDRSVLDGNFTCYYTACTLFNIDNMQKNSACGY